MAELATLERLLKEKNKLEMYVKLLKAGEVETVIEYLESDIKVIDIAVENK